ncbi:MAG: hypothetical protein RL341_698 [Pseudomonadota bacterium]|jgi:hypothetical protein
MRLRFATSLLLMFSTALPMGLLHAATFKVDDSASETLQATSTAQWVSLNPGRGASNDVEVRTRVQVRLNVTPWLNRQGKIYMVSTGQSTTPFVMNWTSSGALLPNRMLQGQRALVYSGKIASAQLSDVFHITLRADGRHLATPTALRFGFEIDVE